MERYLVIVSRDQPELLKTLTSIYRYEKAVEIRLDRRHGQLDSVMREGGDRRSPLPRDALLREHGFVVVSQP